jgi:hypothetical protein
LAEEPAPTLTATADPASTNDDGADGSRIGVAIAVSIGGLVLIVTIIVLTVRRIRRDPFEKPEAPKGDGHPDSER